jgi:hypothetical protein
MTDISKIDGIIANRDAALTSLNIAYAKLNAEKQRIFASASGNPPGEEEKGKVRALDAAMAALYEARSQLMRATVQTLNNAPEAKSLLSTLDGINNQLKEKQTEIGHVATDIAAFGTAIQRIDEIIKMVATLLPLLA